MRYWHSYIALFLLTFLFTSCNDEDQDLPTVEERKAEAIDDLTDMLTDEPNGWKIEYQPVGESGIYFMILQFDNNGEVRILSDVGANQGEFFDHTIPYRVDVGLALELVLETYGVFHYLFELERASFGGEFEFFFVEEANGNLIFQSKTDGVNPTILTFEPANISDASSFSQEVSANFSMFELANRAEIFIADNPTMQLYFPDLDLSLFWETDLTRRFLYIDAIGKGQKINDVINSSAYERFDFNAEFAFSDGNLQLKTPFSFDFDGNNYTIGTVSYGDLTMDGDTFCDDFNTPVYQGNIDGLGDFSMSQTLFKSSGVNFTAIDTSFYLVNIPFIIDNNSNRLSVDGSLAERLPEAVAFIYNYGYENDSLPENGIGFILEDEDRNRDYYLREYVVDSILGNEFNITLEDKYYFSSQPSETDSIAFKEIVEEIFSGGQFYTNQLDGFDFTLFHVYNPCNQYEWLLVQ